MLEYIRILFENKPNNVVKVTAMRFKTMGGIMKKTVKKNARTKRSSVLATKTRLKTKNSKARVGNGKNINKVRPKKKTIVKTKVKAKTGKMVNRTKTIKPSKIVKKVTKLKVAPLKKTVKKAPPKKSIKPKVIINNKQLSKLSLKSQTPKPQTNLMDEEYMDAKQREHFRAILLRWKTQIMEKVDSTKNHMQEEVANYPDPIDRANHEEEFNLELRTRDRERKLIHKIDDALGRLSDGDYGYCDACGAEIGVKRLEARPTATQCIECKKIAEVREKQTGEGAIDF